jgi:ABC-2 type transport system permease protein
MRNLKTAYTIWYRDVLRFFRDRTRIVAALGQPMLYLFIFGTGLSSAMAGNMGGGVDFRAFMFPGIVAMAVLFTAIFSAVSIVWDREFGFLKEVMVAPVSRAAVALGKVAGGSTVAVFQGIIVLVLAPVIGVAIGWYEIAAVTALMLLLAIVMTAFGIMVAARQKTMEGFQMVMQFLMMPMFFLSGAFFPLKGLPGWMSFLSQIDPVTYGVDAIRQEALRRTIAPNLIATLRLHGTGTDVAVMLGLAVLFIVPAVWQFSREQ